MQSVSLWLWIVITNGDGAITLDEFKAGPVGQKNPAIAEEDFKKLDTDGDGKLTLQEFTAPHTPPPTTKPAAPHPKHSAKQGGDRVSPRYFPPRNIFLLTRPNILISLPRPTPQGAASTGYSNHSPRFPSQSGVAQRKSG